MSGKNHVRDLSPRGTGSFYLGLIAVVVLIALIGLTFPSRSRARTWYIKADGTGDAPTIQAGVDSAAAGDTVLVGAGIYDDTTHVWIGGTLAAVNVYLYKNIVLSGESPPPSVLIDGLYSNTAIFVTNVDSTGVISSLTIKRTGAPLGCPLDQSVRRVSLGLTDPGVHCWHASPLIEGNEIVDLGIAVFLERSRSTVRNNRILRVMAGVSCADSSDVIVSGNYFQEFYRAINGGYSTMSIMDNHLDGIGAEESCDGITLYNASAFISNNHIHNIEYDAIWILNDAPAGTVAPSTIENNRIERAHWFAMELAGAHGCLVTNNTVAINNVAMRVSWCYDGVITNNTIDGAAIGISVEDESVVVIRNNIVTRATAGIACVPYTNPSFECNDIFGSDRPYQGCSDQTGVAGNIAADPEYCGVDDSGNYFLQSDSPCAPGNHPDGYGCGLIGAKEVMCGEVDIERRTWGNIKSLYRKEENRDQR